MRWSDKAQRSPHIVALAWLHGGASLCSNHLYFKEIIKASATIKLLQVKNTTCLSLRVVGPWYFFLLLLGSYTGGSFCCESESVRTPPGAHGLILMTNGTLEHYSEPFSGERFSVVAFRHSKMRDATSYDLQQIVELDFPVESILRERILFEESRRRDSRNLKVAAASATVV